MKIYLLIPRDDMRDIQWEYNIYRDFNIQKVIQKCEKGEAGGE